MARFRLSWGGGRALFDATGGDGSGWRWIVNGGRRGCDTKDGGATGEGKNSVEESTEVEAGLEGGRVDGDDVGMRMKQGRSRFRFKSPAQTRKKSLLPGPTAPA
ncbi:hypothetical protein Dda_0930 [Drechslerella dactyloides]|uniref:Uncharacterized protein n=1 Tax=Drechslerella dactyloides TaxID=74499 RepID=A0AAD6J565_DREDA|nr:hypothetical protein Dda_0930 [Drechslerella dactyloides]